MKNILIFAVCVCVCVNKINAQSLTIVNHTTCTEDYYLTMHAQSPTMNAAATGCSSGCDEIYANGVYVPASTTLYWCDPLDFQTGGCSGTAVGWSSVECGTFMSVIGRPCPCHSGGSTLWSGCYPFDFTWTWVQMDQGCLNGCLAGPLGPCATTTVTGTGACSGHYATWTSSSGNVTIDIY